MQSTESTGEVYVRLGLVTEDQVQQAVEKQRQLKTRETLGHVLVSMGLITEKDRVRGLGDHWGVPFVDLGELEVDTEVTKLVAQDIARRLKVLPIMQRAW